MTKSNDIVPNQVMLQLFEYNNPLFECFTMNTIFPAHKKCYMIDHWHEDLEFLYVVEGELSCTVNGTSMMLHDGEGIFINSKRIHSNSSTPGKSCAFYCLEIHPKLISPTEYIHRTYVAPLLNSKYLDYILLSSGDWTNQIIEELIRLFDKGNKKETWELEIIESAMKILRYMYANKELIPQTTGNSTINLDIFKKMLEFITEHYAEKISLDEIAEAGNVGKTLCSKLFKKFVSKTPGDYLIYYRIQKSTEFLTNSGMSITDIGYVTGFSSASHYTKTFKLVMGCTPHKYRADNT